MQNRAKTVFLGGRRGGFTLVEVLVSTALTAVVMSQVAVVLVSSQRIMEATMADVELSIQSHELREKLFYDVYDDGGLMDACKADLDFSKKGGADSVTFKPKKGQKNKVGVGANKRLAASNQKKDKWLECGTMVFQSTNVFDYVATSGVVRVNMDLAILIGSRTYKQQHRMQTVIMNNQ